VTLRKKNKFGNFTF